MDPETERFFRGSILGVIAGVTGWALLMYMIAMLVDRV